MGPARSPTTGACFSEAAPYFLGVKRLLILLISLPRKYNLDVESSSSSLTSRGFRPGYPVRTPPLTLYLPFNPAIFCGMKNCCTAIASSATYGWYQATAGQPPFPASSESETSSTMQQRKAMRAAAETSIA